MLFPKLPATIVFLGSVVVAQAAEISFDEKFLGPLGRSAHVHLNGEIREGDTEKIENFVGNLLYSKDLRIHFSFHSPGGLVAEGLRIGRYISKLPVTTTTNVSQGMGTPGECASACVFAYLGGQYRFLLPSSKLGVHQFHFGEGTNLTTAEGVLISQLVAGEMVDFIDAVRVEPGFFSLISSVHPEDIYWVPKENLREMRVVTDSIVDQKSVYKNAQGYFYLSLWQQSYYGENKIIAACTPSRRMHFSAYIQPPDIETFDHKDYTFEITIDGRAMQPKAAEPAEGRDPRWAITHIALEPYQLEALKSANSFGARHVHPAGIFLGFEYQLEEDKLAELISGCQGPSPAAGDHAEPDGQFTSSPKQDALILLDEPIFWSDTDFPGGDFDSKGIKGTDIRQCAAICRRIDNCLGFSWVESSGWCWPKHTIVDEVPREGVISSLMRR